MNHLRAILSQKLEKLRKHFESAATVSKLVDEMNSQINDLYTKNEIEDETLLPMLEEFEKKVEDL